MESKIAHLLADGFQSARDPLVLRTSTLTTFKGNSFDIEVDGRGQFDESTSYLVTVTEVAS